MRPAFHSWRVVCPSPVSVWYKMRDSPSPQNCRCTPRGRLCCLLSCRPLCCCTTLLQPPLRLCRPLRPTRDDICSAGTERCVATALAPAHQEDPRSRSNDLKGTPERYPLLPKGTPLLPKGTPAFANLYSILLFDLPDLSD